jgi:type II secretory pathway pseudopilin PulG
MRRGFEVDCGVGLGESLGHDVGGKSSIATGFMVLEIVLVLAVMGLFLPVLSESLLSLRRGWQANQIRETRLLAIENAMQRQDWTDATLSSVEAYSPSYNIVVFAISEHETIRVLVPSGHE